MLDARSESLDADERVLACELLGRGSTGAGRRRLLEALVQADPMLRAAAARALARRRDPEALEALVRRFEEEAGRGGRRRGARAARPTPSPRSPGPSPARATASPARAARMLAERLAEASEAYRGAAARVLGRLGDAEDGGGARAAALGSEPRRAPRGGGGARAASRGTCSPSRCASRCADEAPAVRIAAAAALGALLRPRAPSTTSSGSRATRTPRCARAALRAAGALRSPAATEALARRLALLERGAAEGGPAAMAALEALRALGDPRAVGVAARARSSPTRPELVRARRRLPRPRGGGPRSSSCCCRSLGHESWAVRAEAIRVLAERGVRKAVPALLRRLEAERDEFVREALLRALERLER